VSGNEEVKVSIFGFVITSLCDWCQMFGDGIVVKMSVKKKRRRLLI
jgi:hypothetical protein